MREISGLAKFGYFCVGLFGGLFGVLAAWFMGKDGWGWSEGGKLFAWFGCLFWLIVWVVMVVTGGIAAFLGMLFYRVPDNSAASIVLPFDGSNSRMEGTPWMDGRSGAKALQERRSRWLQCW